jgi:hypothetical protein
LPTVQLSTGLKPLCVARIEDAENCDSRTRASTCRSVHASSAGRRRQHGVRVDGGIQVGSIRSIKLRNITIASRGRQITVSADSSLSSAHLNVERFTAASGKTSLTASGLAQLSPRLDAQLAVKADHVDCR